MDSVANITMREQKRFGRVCMVGCFPPPVHGVAAVNIAVRDRLRAEGADLLVINLAAFSLRRGARARLGRLPKVLHGLARLLVARGLKGGTMYMSVSGGLGQVYECLFVLLARCKKLRVVLHHHSFAYLDQRRMLTVWLAHLAGARTVHVVLSEGMGQHLMAHYRCGEPPLVMSNVSLLPSAQEVKGRESVVLQTIGFLANLSSEKGVFIFLDVCDAIARAKLPLHARLAGPFQDERTEQKARQRLAALPMVEYVGPQYGEAKQMFYRSLDVLLFPTRYLNEAEPLVVLEALQQGLPVIAYGRGAIPELLDADCGIAVLPGADFVSAAMKALRTWYTDPASLAWASRAATARFVRIRTHGQYGWGQLSEVLLRNARAGA